MSSMVIKTYHKTVVERRRLYMDYSCWLAADEQLTGFQVSVSPYTEDAPIVVDTSYPDAEHKKLVAFVAGGKGNTQYVLSMIVNTDSGQIKRDDIGVKVNP